MIKLNSDNYRINVVMVVNAPFNVYYVKGGFVRHITLIGEKYFPQTLAKKTLKNMLTCMYLL